jgi:hypothetical protein
MRYYKLHFVTYGRLTTWTVKCQIRKFKRLIRNTVPQKHSFILLQKDIILLSGEVKVKLPLYRPRSHKGSGVMAPPNLNLDNGWRWVINFTPDRYTSGEVVRVPIEQEADPRAGMAMSEKRKPLAPAGKGH